METVYIGLGANLGCREETIKAAVEEIRAWPWVSGLILSPLYQTEPVGPVEQPDYLNGVIRFDTDRDPEQLLNDLLELEAKLGRVRTLRWGPRTLDLDLLFFGARVMETPNLSLPHPRLHERGFVLAPLQDLAPDLHHPLQKATIRELYRRWAATPSTRVFPAGDRKEGETS